MSTLSGKWALVTGATAGLGLAVAESLAAAGANLVVHDLAAPRDVADSPHIPLWRRRDQHCRRPVATRRHRGHDGATSWHASTGSTSSSTTRWSGILPPVENFSPERWDEALAVNLSAPFHLIRLALPAMKRRGFGRIINMASIYSTRAVADRIDYVTTKTAIVGMTRAIAIETANDEYHLQCAVPGHAADAGHPVEDRNRGRAGWPLRRRGHAGLSGDASADRTVHRDRRRRRHDRVPLQPAAQDITGAALPIDGGWSIA